MRKPFRYLVISIFTAGLSLAIYNWCSSRFVYHPAQQFIPPDRKEVPPPTAVEEWLSKHAIRLRTTDPRNDLSDMKPLLNVIGHAQVACLGEATHGTREFFEMKHRMLEFLVTQMGFNVFAIEATFPESFEINKYILTGQGDPAKALAGLYFWTINTEEVLDMIQWMRKYNAEPTHLKKIKFYGFDMQFPEKAALFVMAYLKKVDPMQAKHIEDQLAIVRNERRSEPFKKMPRDAQDRLCSQIAKILRMLDQNKPEYIAQSSIEEWSIARQHLRVIQQYYSGGLKMRDQAMAENILWIKKHEGPTARMVVWAHNGHVATNQDNASGNKPMGWYLKRDLGKDMLVIGFCFNQGTFQAKTARRSALEKIDKKPRRFTVGSAPIGSLDWTLAKAGLKLAAIDLRSIPKKGTVANWFSKPHATRSLGAVYDPPEDNYYYAQDVITHMFDVLIFVERSTSARPVVPN